MQLHRALFITSRRDGYNWPQRYGLEDPAAIGFEKQGATGVVLIGDDVDLCPRAQREITQQMTRGERGNEEVFRIVNVAVAAKHRIGAPNELRLPFDLQPILASVSGVAGRAGAKVAVPDQTSFVVV